MNRATLTERCKKLPDNLTDSDIPLRTQDLPGTLFGFLRNDSFVMSQDAEGQALLSPFMLDEIQSMKTCPGYFKGSHVANIVEPRETFYQKLYDELKKTFYG
jgi:hypothetical protein|tara:strand:- start:37 stop:342 length:306 start_codon:yes stop_codon:yes gene_type:complete